MMTAIFQKEDDLMDMSIWFLVGAILVFFMQCGFAMVETGFTRAKNAGNIITYKLGFMDNVHFYLLTTKTEHL